MPRCSCAHRNFVLEYFFGLFFRCYLGRQGSEAVEGCAVGRERGEVGDVSAVNQRAGFGGIRCRDHPSAFRRSCLWPITTRVVELAAVTKR